MQSLRRRERLEKRCRELELLQRGAVAMAMAVPTLDAEDVEDLEEAPDIEVEAAEALRYNGPVQSWPEITRLARETP